MTPHIQQFYQVSLKFDGLLAKIHSIAAIVARLYIAEVFISAGLTKIKDWETTLFLFEEEYQVPILPFEFAAYLGTFGELLFPVLLFLGLTTKFAAIGLFVVNAVAVISLSEIAPAALYLHVIWGILLAQLIIYGGGTLSIDNLLKRLSLRVHTTPQQ